MRQMAKSSKHFPNNVAHFAGSLISALYLHSWPVLSLLGLISRECGQTDKAASLITTIKIH